MSTYEYKGYDVDGKSAKGLIEALSVKNAREKLVGRGILAETVSMSGRRLKFPVEMRAIVYRELSVLLGSGMTLDKSLEMMINSPELSKMQILLAGVRDSVREGMSLSEAFGDASSSLSDFEKAIIEAAQESATVEQMLDRLADFIEEQENLKGRILNALIYPIIVTVVGICMAVGMLVYVVPKTSKILEGTSITMPKLTVAMVMLGKFLMSWGWVFIVVAIGLVLYIRHKQHADSAFREQWNKSQFSLPLYGKGYTILVNLRFARTLSILLNGGVSVIDGFIMAGRATGSPWIARMAEKESETVRHGTPLSEAIRQIPPLAESLPGWIEVGEASGGLEGMLESAGKRCDNRWDRYVSRTLSIMEPVLMLIIGIFILIIALSVVLPIVALTNSISG